MHSRSLEEVDTEGKAEREFERFFKFARFMTSRLCSGGSIGSDHGIMAFGKI